MKPISSAAVLEARDLSVIYGQRKVLDISRIEVAPDQVLSIIGPNGSGKTTLSLCLALLLKPSSGQIYYQGRAIGDGEAARPIRRRFAVVFQEPLLLNNSVWNNVTLGLHLRGIKGPEVKKRADFWLERFGILNLANRHTRTLSGGEAQRVSLARAFVLQPEVLFLDEPFAALDTPTRHSLFGDMINILKETRFATVLITHDRNEAQTLSNRIVVLFQGKIVQEGTPREIFSAPASEEIARFVGMENIVEGRIVANQDGLAEIKVDSRTIEGVSSCSPGQKVNIFIRPEDVTLSIARPSSSARNTLSGTIINLIPEGPLVRVSLDCGFPLVALITRISADGLQLGAGQTVFASFKAAAIHISPQ